jgi:hypothetical protein
MKITIRDVIKSVKEWARWSDPEPRRTQVFLLAVIWISFTGSSLRGLLHRNLQSAVLN